MVDETVDLSHIEKLEEICVLVKDLIAKYNTEVILNKELRVKILAYSDVITGIVKADVK